MHSGVSLRPVARNCLHSLFPNPPLSRRFDFSLAASYAPISSTPPCFKEEPVRGTIVTADVVVVYQPEIDVSPQTACIEEGICPQGMPLAGRAVPRTDLLKPSTTASCHRRAVSLLSMGVRKERHSTLIYSQRRRVDSCEDVVIMTFNEAVRGGRSFPFANYTHESTGQGMRGLCVHSARPLWPPLGVPLVEVRYRSLSPTSIRVGSMGTVALTFLDRLCWGMLSGIVRGQSRWSNGDGEGVHSPHLRANHLG